MNEIYDDVVHTFWSNINMICDEGNITLHDIADNTGLKYASLNAARWRALSPDGREKYMLRMDVLYKVSEYLGLPITHLLSTVTESDINTLNKHVKHIDEFNHVPSKMRLDTSDLASIFLHMTAFYGIPFEFVVLHCNCIIDSDNQHIGPYNIDKEKGEDCDDTYKALIWVLDKERKERRMSIADLAHRAGYKKPNVVSNIINKKTNPGLDTFLRCADVLGLGMDEIQSRACSIGKSDVSNERISIKHYLMDQIESNNKFTRRDVSVLISVGWYGLSSQEQYSIKAHYNSLLG